MDLQHRADDFNEMDDSAAMGGMEAQVMPAPTAPEDQAGEEMDEGAIGAALPGAGQTKEALMSGASMQAVDAALQPLGVDEVVVEETVVALNRAQWRALGIKPVEGQQAAQIGGMPPPVAEEDVVDPDAFTFEGTRLLVGWDELLEEAAKPVDRVIGPFEAETLAIASGEPGRGKSLLSLTLSVAVAGGVEFAGIKPSRAQSVLLFSPEDKIGVIGARIKAAVEELRADADLVKRNLRVIKVRGSTVIFEGTGESLDFNPLGRTLRKAIRGRRARFVVLDPFIELHTADENSNMQVHALLAMLRTLAQETASLIFLTHHSAKGGQGPRGAGAFNGTVRASLHVEALGKKEAKAAEAQGLKPASIFRLIFIKDNYGEDDGGATYFQKVAIRPGEAPVLRRVVLEVKEDE